MTASSFKMQNCCFSILLLPQKITKTFELTWLSPLRIPLVPILPGPSMAVEAPAGRQWWPAQPTALNSRTKVTLSTSVRRPGPLWKCTLKMEEYGLDLFQKYMRDLYIYVLETSEEILFEARQNNFLRLSTWSADNLSPLEGQLVMTGRHGRPQTPWTQTGSSFPGTHGKPSGGTRPKYSKQALFLAKL